MSTAVIYLVHGTDLIEMFHNSALSLRKSGFKGPLIAYTTHASTSELEKICLAVQAEVRTIQMENFSVEESYHNIGSAEFAYVSWHKFRIIKDALSQHQTVIFSDCDIYYFRDPTPFIQKAAGTYPMGGQSDCFDVFPQQICTGFLFFRRDASVIQLLDHCFDIAMENAKRGVFAGHDQQVFNSVFTSNARFYSSFYFLSEFYFPNGASYKYFSSEKLDYSVAKNTPYIFHANYVVGLEDKTRLLKHVGGWLDEVSVLQRQ